MTIFITSDTHLGHKNIIDYCNRPFSSVEEMDAELIRKWNEVVGPNDVVYHLGDVCMRKSMTAHYTEQLNGDKTLVLGNHDRSFSFMEKCGWRCASIMKGEEIRLVERERILRIAHRPRDLHTWTQENKDEVVLCGHEHNNAPIFVRWVRQKNDKPRRINALNMCVEHWDFAPVPLKVVIETYDKHMAEVRAHR